MAVVNADALEPPIWLITITGMVLGASIFAAGMYVGAAIVR